MSISWEQTETHINLITEPDKLLAAINTHSDVLGLGLAFAISICKIINAIVYYIFLTYICWSKDPPLQSLAAVPW